MPIRIACIGAGPGGLFLGTMVKRLIPDARVTVFERNRAQDAFGFGVVFSDRTLDRINAADPVLHDGLAANGVHWDPIEVRLGGERLRFAGNGMAAIHRRTLLAMLRERAIELGVDIRYSTPAPDVHRLAAEHDLVVAADGTNSASRDLFADALHPQVETAAAKFIWFGTTYRFDGLTFIHRRNEHGAFAVHGYPLGPDIGTFIVETDESTWRAVGLDEFETGSPPGPSDGRSKAYLERLFAADIDGHPLVGNNSRWGNFRTRRTASWHCRTGAGAGTDAGTVAWLGDAVHTAHFSVGSGTKMAMEDAISLAEHLAAAPGDIPAALAGYEAQRQPEVAGIQDSARPSLSWWENFGRYQEALEPWQFGFHFFSRSIPAARMRRRDPRFVAGVEERWRAAHGTDPLSTPLPIGDRTVGGRTGTLAADERTLTFADGTAVEVDRPDAARTPAGAALVVAPKSEGEIDAGVAAFTAAGGAGLAVITGGNPLTRTLLSERLRFAGLCRTAIVLDAADADQALTLVLSGRADAAAYPAGGPR